MVSTVNFRVLNSTRQAKARRKVQRPPPPLCPISGVPGLKTQNTNKH